MDGVGENLPSGYEIGFFINIGILLAAGFLSELKGNQGASQPRLARIVLS
jgi:hypothetical protein